MSFEIREVRALARRPRRDEAQLLLERIAAHALPILSRWRFRVLYLQEFFPKSAHLLGMNVNRGVKIYLRLRPAARPKSFYPFEALLETMLHELTHMVHGPHNQAFYALLDELKTEMETLMIRGLIGSDVAKFRSAGEGRVIGASRSIPVRFQNDSTAAVLAAKRRAQYLQLLGGHTSRRLGSGNAVDLAASTPATPSAMVTQEQLRQRVLEAAERRYQDNERCTVADALTQSVEVLGIDDSDAEDGEKDVPVRPPAAISLVDCAAPPDVVCVSPVFRIAQSAAPAGADIEVVDLVDDCDEETKSEVDDAVLQQRTANRKRKLSAAVDTIDLTGD